MQQAIRFLMSSSTFKSQSERSRTKYRPPKKRTMSVKKVMDIFFSNEGPAIQISVAKERFANAKFNKGKVVHKLKTYFIKRRPATCLRYVKLLHNNAFPHRAAVVRDILKQEQFVELPNPPFWPLMTFSCLQALKAASRKKI